MPRPAPGGLVVAGLDAAVGIDRLVLDGTCHLRSRQTSAMIRRKLFFMAFLILAVQIDPPRVLLLLDCGYLTFLR